MTRVNKITLVKETVTTDNIGQMVTQETTTDLIAEIRSVSQSEFMNGRQAGLVPSQVFRISRFAYSGEKVLEYSGCRFAIYRTYEADDNYIELYTQVEEGVSYG